jgi:hypothetical protein
LKDQGYKTSCSQKTQVLSEKGLILKSPVLKTARKNLPEIEKKTILKQRVEQQIHIFK